MEEEGVFDCCIFHPPIKHRPPGVLINPLLIDSKDRLTKAQVTVDAQTPGVSSDGAQKGAAHLNPQPTNFS